MIMRQLFSFLLAGVFFLSSGCTNQSSENNTTSDTTVNKDTIKSDPEKFSDPH